MTTNQALGPVPTGREAIAGELTDHLTTRLRTRVDPDQDLFETGLITSMFAMELVVHLERTFAVSIVGPDLRMGSFRSVTAMSELVDRLQRAASADGS
jgi:methoxymalonate biosynthesis acyl carrier protein